MRVPTEDDEPAVPRRRLKRRVAAYGDDEGRTDSGGFGIPEIMYLLSVLIILALPLLLGTWRGILPGAMISGTLLIAVGFYGAMIAARGAEIWERIVYVLVPIYHFYYWAKFWDDTRRYVACYGVGFGLIVVSFGIAAALVAQRKQHEDKVWNEFTARNDASRKAFFAENEQRAQKAHQDQQRLVQSLMPSHSLPPDPNQHSLPQYDPLREAQQAQQRMSALAEANAQQQQQMQQIQQRLQEGRNRQRQQMGLPPLGPPPSSPPTPAESPPARTPEVILKETAQPVPLAQLLQISRQVKGKFEPEVGMQLFVKRADGEWYLAEVTAVPSAQKAKVRFAYDRDAADGVVNRDKVRIPNGPWPRFPEIATEAPVTRKPE